jgi:hypothetical protein
MSEGGYSVYNLGFTVIQTKDGLKAVNHVNDFGRQKMSNGHIWLEKRVKKLEEKLDEISKDRDDWAKKYQELSKKNEVTYDFDHTKGFATQYTHIPYGYKLVAHNDGTITVTLGGMEEK